MSTTVSYKGNTITTLSNETKTLTTAGTWVEGDITIMDVMSGVDVPVFTITWDSNWSTIISITCSKTFSECYNRGQQEEKYDAILIGTDGTIVYENGENYNLKYNSETYSDYILLTIADVDGYPYAELIYNSDGTFEYNNSTRVGQTLNVSTNGTYTPSWGQMYNNVVVNVPSSSPSLQAKTNISPTTSSQTITADSGYDGLSSVQINAMPTGTAGTPTATKGTVSNHSVSVTPSVTNTTGYITGGTKTGTAVTITASELVSGNKAITDNGNNIDVVDYSTVSVNVEPDDFLVTLSYNSTTEKWEPDKSLTEIQTANTLGKNICLELNIENNHLEYSADGRYTSNGYEYVIRESSSDSDNHFRVNEYYYILSSNGLNIVDNYIYYDTSDSNVTASNVVSGVGFYGSNGYDTGTVTVRSSTDLTASGATVTAPAGYYSASASKSVASGTTGTPSASKGTVSNHSISVTPSVTNTTGYITGGTKNGTAVTVTASELVSGTLSITSSGTKDVTNYASASVAAGTEGTPTATKGTVSNHQVTVTPSVTNSAGYISGSTKTGTAVTITASELASGNKEITTNGTNIDVVGYSTVSIAVPGASLQAKTGINPTTSSQTITADSGYDGLSSVQINAMPTMTLPTSASSSSSGTSKATIGRSASAQYINIPTGYNGTASYYTISATPNGSATTPATTITANPTITVSSSGLITATASASQNITPTVSAGYVSSGTAGTITVSGSKTQQLTTKGATTYNTSTTDQTIASGTYLTGTQTIKAVTVSGLDASKILSGTTVMIGDANDADRIASVSGSVTFSTITTSTSNPSGGSDGDIWIKTS